MTPPLWAFLDHACMVQTVEYCRAYHKVGWWYDRGVIKAQLPLCSLPVDSNQPSMWADALLSQSALSQGLHRAILSKDLSFLHCWAQLHSRSCGQENAMNLRLTTYYCYYCHYYYYLLPLLLPLLLLPLLLLVLLPPLLSEEQVAWIQTGILLAILAMRASS